MEFILYLGARLGDLVVVIMKISLSGTGALRRGGASAGSEVECEQGKSIFKRI